MEIKNHYDAIVIGGGFYGCSVALELSNYGHKVCLLEREAEIMQKASYVNQARIHQGYHYPRSILTALRSRVNFERFNEEFSDCVYSSFDKYYAIGKISSKVNAEQFRLFCDRIGAPHHKAPKHIKALFNPNLVEDILGVREYAFDSVKLKKIMFEHLHKAQVELLLNTGVDTVKQLGNKLRVNYSTNNSETAISANYLFNCTYSRINQVMDNSTLSLIPLKHESTEMALVNVPEPLKKIGITIMDGPFFSVMPFPARQLHSLSHVRYTPHNYWQDDQNKPFLNADKHIELASASSFHVHMLKDAQRYLPILSECQYMDSLWEVKTVLPQSEVDDSRPILFRRSEQLPNMISIMGGKIDNIFDIREKLATFLENEPRQA